jgi:hypothetical protein
LQAKAALTHLMMLVLMPMTFRLLLAPPVSAEISQDATYYTHEQEKDKFGK